METLFFTASDGSVDSEGELLAISFGSEASNCYLAIARFVDDVSNIYIALNDQANGGYNKIAGCSLSRSNIHIRLTEPIDYEKRYSEVSVVLEIGGDAYTDVAETLTTIFEGSSVDFSRE